jgi:hypothetical protein
VPTVRYRPSDASSGQAASLPACWSSCGFTMAWPAAAMAAAAGLSAVVMTEWATASGIWVRPARDRPVARSGLTPSVVARPAAGVPVAHAQPAAPGQDRTITDMPQLEKIAAAAGCPMPDPEQPRESDHAT